MRYKTRVISEETKTWVGKKEENGLIEQVKKIDMGQSSPICEKVITNGSQWENG